MRSASISIGALIVTASACGGAPAAPPAAPAVAAATASAPPPSPCASGAHYHDFDFWLGAWDVTSGGKPAGHNEIERGQRGCTLIERWTSSSGGTGTSLNVYDPARRHWRQLWIDASGDLADLEGELTGGAMILEGPYTKADGTVSRLRGTWTPSPDGSVRQYFEESKDGGAIWSVWFDGHYAHAR